MLCQARGLHRATPASSLLVVLFVAGILPWSLAVAQELPTSAAPNAGGATKSEVAVKSEDAVESARRLLNADKGQEAVQVLEDAIASLSARVKERPDDAPAQYEFARVLFEIQRDDEAKTAIEQALMLQPRNPDFHLFRAQMHYQHGEKRAAEGEFHMALKFAPRHGKYRYEYARFLASTGRREEMLKELRQAVADDPKFLPALLDLAATLIGVGKSDEAMSLLRQAVEQNPTDSEARRVYGQALQNAGEIEKAYEQFTDLAKIDPLNFVAESKLVQLCEALKKPAERDGHLARVRKLFDDGHASQEWFCREQFAVGDKQVMALEFFELKGPMALKYRFDVTDKKGDKPLLNVTLGSYDFTTQLGRELGQIEKNERLFHLDSYAGREHRTFGMFGAKPPTYAETRKMVVEIIEGKRQPAAGSLQRVKKD